MVATMKITSICLFYDLEIIYASQNKFTMRNKILEAKPKDLLVLLFNVQGDCNLLIKINLTNNGTKQHLVLPVTDCLYSLKIHLLKP